MVATPLQEKPTSQTVYWRSDIAGSIDDVYTVKVLFTTPDGHQAGARWELKSRLLDPSDAKIANNFNEDSDMAQRLMIQTLGMDKGRLESYRIGQYDVGRNNGWYVSSRNMNTKQWASIADEVDNFDHFALGHFGAHSENLRLATLQGMWKEFGTIQSTPLDAVNAGHANYDAWGATETGTQSDLN